MGKELDLIIEAIGRTEVRVDKLADGVAEVAGHCATLLERTQHLATREDLSTTIRTHVAELHKRGSKDSLAPRRMSGPMVRLIKALAAFLAIAGSVLGAYFGLR